MLFILIIIFAIIVPIIIKKLYKRQIHFFEFVGYALVMMGIIFGVYKFNINNAIKDTEVLNGLIIRKATEKETCVYDDSFSRCRNDYSCNCYSCNPHDCACDEDGNNCSTCYDTCCHTCFTYPWEKFYMAYHSFGKFEISRIDKQGKNEPPRFTKVKIGDPVAVKHKYKNYILGAKYSLYSKELIESKEHKIPTYPVKIYDYHYLDRVILIGSNLPKLDYKKFNYEYSKFLGEVGKKKQLNSVLVLTDKPQKFSKVLEAKWVGGKKNDVVIVVGTNKKADILWVYSFGWSKNNRVFIELRENLINKKVNLEIIGIIRKACEDYFERKPMQEFEYLKSEIKGNFKALQIIGVVLISGLILYFFINNSVFEEDENRT